MGSWSINNNKQINLTKSSTGSFSCPDPQFLNDVYTHYFTNLNMFTNEQGVTFPYSVHNIQGNTTMSIKLAPAIVGTVWDTCDNKCCYNTEDSCKHCFGTKPMNSDFNTPGSNCFNALKSMKSDSNSNEVTCQYQNVGTRVTIHALNIVNTTTCYAGTDPSKCGSDGCVSLCPIT